jgi:hypothetical protein
MTIAIVIVGALQAVILAWQAVALYRTLTAINRQVIANEKSANAAKLNAEALVNSMRAWIVVDKISPPPEMLMPQPSPAQLMVMTFVFRFRNCGKTIARVKEGRIRFHTVETSKGLPPIPEYGLKSNLPEIPGGMVIVPDETFQGRAFLEGNMLSEEQIAAIKQHTLSLYVYGFFAYQDFQGNDHELRFCYVYRFPTGLILVDIDKDEFILGGPKPYNEST